mmetsp:Transcript_30446/g.86858  ORF Transcript_30446/g.86858 Transcript_30446/m.86858 type:complete len:220 (-) Transcript_30446:91-750(-)
MTARTSPLATESPTFFLNSMSVPSVMLSAPKSLMPCSMILPGDDDAGAAAAGAAALGAGFAATDPPAAPKSMENSACPRAIVSSGCANNSLTMPDSSALISTVTLSVSMLAMSSPLVTASPTFFLNSTSEPSVILSAPKSLTIWVKTLPDENARACFNVREALLSPTLGRVEAKLAGAAATVIGVQPPLQSRAWWVVAISLLSCPAVCKRLVADIIRPE